jgi:hypothetical protein
MARTKVISVALPLHSIERLNRLSELYHRSRSSTVAFLIEIVPLVEVSSRPRKKREAPSTPAVRDAVEPQREVAA